MAEDCCTRAFDFSFLLRRWWSRSPKETTGPRHHQLYEKKKVELVSKQPRFHRNKWFILTWTGFGFTLLCLPPVAFTVLSSQLRHGGVTVADSCDLPLPTGYRTRRPGGPQTPTPILTYYKESQRDNCKSYALDVFAYEWRQTSLLFLVASNINTFIKRCKRKGKCRTQSFPISCFFLPKGHCNTGSLSTAIQETSC